MSVPILAIAAAVALTAFFSLVFFGVPIWLALISYCVVGATTTLATAWIVYARTAHADPSSH